MTTDTDHFNFTRQYPLSPERMWHLMTDSAMRAQWGAPGEDVVLEMIRTDLKVGGIERHRCGPAENPEFEVETRWYRLDAPSDAVFTEVIEAGGARLGTGLVTYRIAADGSGSTVDVTVAVSSFVGAEMNTEFENGWKGGIDNLDRLVAEQAEA